MKNKLSSYLETDSQENLSGGGVFSLLHVWKYTLTRTLFHPNRGVGWEKWQAREPEVAAEQRGLCLEAEDVMWFPCVSWAGSNGRIAVAVLPKQDKHKETFFPSVKEEAGCLSHFMVPWLAYWEFIGRVAHMEILWRNSKAFAGRDFYLKVKGKNGSVSRRAHGHY